MRKLAKIISGDLEIKNVEAVSWIVAKTPRMFTKNGFTVDKINEKDFEGRDQALAYINKEEFLKRFLEEK